MAYKVRMRRGVTLIELVVSLSIFGLILALVLMGVQAAREAARQMSCQNNVRQLGIATSNHISANKFFPSGGWGYKWLGVSELGFGNHQPGGWAYSLLPHLEATNTYNIVSTVSQASTNLIAVKNLVQSKPPVFSCPARGLGNTSISNDIPYYGLHFLEIGYRTDYAVNGGNSFYLSIEGPANFADGKNFRFPSANRVNGICWFGSQLLAAEVTDGLSNTFLIGEKWIGMRALGEENNQPLFSGDCLDVRRFTLSGPRPDSRMIESSALAFGSRHSGVNFTMCDGSTHTISYRIDEQIFSNLGNRKDGSISEF